MGLFVVSQTYACPFLSSLPSLPHHQHLKNHSHSRCLRAHARRNYGRSAGGCLDNSRASLCVGTGGPAKFPRPLGEGEGGGGEEAVRDREAGARSHGEERAASGMKGAHTSPLGQREFCWLAVKRHTEDTMVCDT